MTLVLSTGGCAAYRPTESGYLSDYSQLKKARFHLNPGLGFQQSRSRFAGEQGISEVDSFYIEPVLWLVDPATRGGKDPARQEYLTGKLDAALREQLAKLKPIVDEPGPRTATIRSAITTVRLSRPISNVLLTATLITPIAIGPIFIGGAAIEAEAIGPDGRQLAAISSTSGGGMIDIVGFYAKSDHARKAMKRNARELRQALER